MDLIVKFPFFVGWDKDMECFVAETPVEFEIVSRMSCDKAIYVHEGKYRLVSHVKNWRAFNEWNTSEWEADFLLSQEALSQLVKTGFVEVEHAPESR